VHPHLTDRPARHGLAVRCALLLLTVLLIACGESSPVANAEASFEIAGDCSSCPPQRIDTLLRQVAGVISTRFDTATDRLMVSYDSTRVGSSGLVSVLNEAGYDADDALALFPSLVDRCCLVSNPALDSLRRIDTLRLSPSERARLYELIAQAREGGDELELDALDPDDESALTEGTLDENIEGELGGVLEAELLGPEGDDDDTADDLDDDLGLPDDDDDKPTPAKPPVKAPTKADTTKGKRPVKTAPRKPGG